ncbi:MAG TPA: phosphate signaling complex protein PhoU [Bacillota bacterium]
MSVRESFDRELQVLQKDLLKMGMVAEDMVHKSLQALANRDVALADAVMSMDDEVDRLNLEIESKCLRLIALQQPMAKDLRTIAAAMKIITDVERVGDYAVDIAKEAVKLADRPLFKPLIDIPKMAELVQKMLRESLEGFVTRDLNLIHQMIRDDDGVDHLFKSLFEELIQFMERDSSLVFQAVHLLMITRCLERIADHITNMGERVIYMETGEIKELHA